MHRFSHDYHDIAEKFKLPSISSVRDYNDLLFTHNCIHHQDTMDICYSNLFTIISPLYAFRYSNKVVEVLCRSDHLKATTIYRISATWNHLPDHLRTVESASKFISLIKKFIYVFN